MWRNAGGSVNYYSPDSHCKKCGARKDLISTKHARIQTYDVIRRSCGRCGFVWDEAPLDMEEWYAKAIP